MRRAVMQRPDEEEDSDQDVHPAAHGSWDAPDIVREKRGAQDYQIDAAAGRFPFAITWTPLPMITWFLPFVGHMGICDSRGVIYDFAGPYTIGIDQMAFGSATRYLVLDPGLAAVKAPGQTAAQAWDAGVDSGSEAYSHRMHNLLCDNCHSHVARALNDMRYGGRASWGMVGLAAWMFFAGKYVSLGRAIYTWAPFAVIAAIVIIVSTLRR